MDLTATWRANEEDKEDEEDEEDEERKETISCMGAGQIETQNPIYLLIDNIYIYIIMINYIYIYIRHITAYINIC